VTPPGERIISQLMSGFSPDEQKIFGLLATVYDAALPSSHIAAITGVADAPAILLRLTQARMTEPMNGGYRLTKEPAGALIQVVGPQQWTQPSIRHFAAWADRFASDPRLILAVADLLLKVIELATDTQRWKEVWQLVRAVQRSLALSGRWAAWQIVLNSGLRAAHALEDMAGQGWALHQLGTRSLCLGDAAAASTLLNQALSIRRAIGDSEGVAATSHNLQRLTPPPPPPRPPPTPQPRLGALRWFLSLGISLALVVIFAVYVWPLPGPVLSFEPNQPVDFPQVAVGKPAATMTVKLHNTGSRSLRLSESGISVSPAFALQSNDCPLQLSPDQSCAVTLAFTPRTVGPQVGSLSVIEAGGSVHTVQVKGAGLAFTPGSLTFGKQTVKVPGKAFTIQLKNWGDTDLVIPSIIPTGDFKASRCAEQTRTIAPGATCTVAVTFAPTSPGAKAEKLVVTDDRGNQYVAALNGVGLVPIAEVVKSIIFAPAQGTPVAHPLRIYNKGEGSLVISSISLGPITVSGSDGKKMLADSSTFSWTDSTPKPCIGVQIPTADSCEVELTFTAPADYYKVGYREYKADLQIIDNDLVSPQTVSLYGNNVPPPIQ
jgi:hypothetical protein